MNSKILPRTNEIETLIEIIKNKGDYKENSENGLVILLNGEWGMGKSTFLKEFVSELSNLQNIEIFNNYNAYENDYYDNAYIPFFASIENKIKLNKDFPDFIRSLGGKTSNGLVVATYSITKNIVENKLGINIDDIKNNLIEIEREKIDCDYVKEYNDLKEYKVKIKNKMNELCFEKTQVFIIDELDRCKPSFAMETLEIVKHFFDIQNCVFIISVDKMQLQESIKAIYGSINSEKYFSKLFDYQFNLLPINFSDVIEYNGQRNLSELIRWSSVVFGILNVSLRDSKKIFNELINKNEKWSIRQSLFMLFLFILKYTDLSFYNAIMNEDYLKYKQLFEENYNCELEKYKRLFKYKIANELLYGTILEELNVCINYECSDLYNPTKNYSMMIAGNMKEKSEIKRDIITYIPELRPGMTVLETIRKIMG